MLQPPGCSHQRWLSQYLMNSCLCRCQPEPSSPWSALEPTLHITQDSSDGDCTSATGPEPCAGCKVLPAVHPALPPMSSPAPSPSCCRAGTRPSSHALTQVVWLIQLENGLALERQRVTPQLDQPRSPAPNIAVPGARAGAKWARARACGCQAPAPRQNRHKWLLANLKGRLCLQLALLSLMSCITVQQRQVSPRVYL